MEENQEIDQTIQEEINQEEHKEFQQEEETQKVQTQEEEGLGLHSIKNAFKEEIISSQTMFHRGSVRSGQKVEYQGSIVILGDVNSGSEIIAGENIIILGDLRGLAHAGAKGNKEAIVAANRIECPQMRIANIIKQIETSRIGKIYTYAYVNEEDKIVLE